MHRRAASGPGTNGPLLLVAELPPPVVEQRARPASPTRVRGDHGVAAVTPPTVNPAGDTAILTVVPTDRAAGPGAPRTSCTTLRDDVLPDATAGDRR